MFAKIKAPATNDLQFFQCSKDLTVKISMIAAATFLFFTWQYRIGVVSAYKMTLGISTFSFFCEKLIQRPKSPSITDNSRCHSFAIYLMASKVTQIFVSCLYAGEIKVIAIQEIAKKLIALNPEALITSLVIAPFAEEVLFRGFVKERIEDVLYLMSYLRIVSESVIAQIANVAQAVIFGYIHIIFGQVHYLKDKIVVFFNTSLLGFASGALKNIHGNYVPSISLHVLSNLHSTFNLVLNPQS